MKGGLGHIGGHKVKKHKNRGKMSEHCHKYKKHKKHGRHQGKHDSFSPSLKFRGADKPLSGRSKHKGEGLIARVDAELCEACGKCLKFCREGAITVTREGAEINAALCVGCGDCVGGCPMEALTLVSP